jgi:hypothetical protein
VHESPPSEAALRPGKLWKCRSDHYSLGYSKDISRGELREQQLTNKFWGEFLMEGAIFRRHTRGTKSAISIVRHLLEKTPIILRFQKELAQYGIIGRTSAGEELIHRLIQIRADCEEEVMRLEKEIKVVAVAGLKKEAAAAAGEKAKLEAKVREVSIELERIHYHIRTLEKTLAERWNESGRRVKLFERDDGMQSCTVQ